jgi:hypothetical protein
MHYIIVGLVKVYLYKKQFNFEVEFNYRVICWEVIKYIKPDAKSKIDLLSIAYSHTRHTELFA